VYGTRYFGHFNENRHRIILFLKWLYQVNGYIDSTALHFSEFGGEIGRDYDQV
jgi:hypothetical protein